MSKISISRWKCDRCSADGGLVDDDETVPLMWLVISLLIAVPQLQHEQRNPPTAHFCDKCAEWLRQEMDCESPPMKQIRAIIARAGLARVLGGES